MAERRPLIAGNWKMHKTCTEAVATAEQLAQQVAGIDSVDVMIAPPFTAIAAVAAALRNSPVMVGAQNVFWEQQGAYTGEISAAMLVSAGCRFVIIGHSERRQFFGETDQTVNRKIQSALEAGLIPVFCVGETDAERQMDQTFAVLQRQVEKGLNNIVLSRDDDLVVAYEPVWAIGTGKTATVGQAQQAHAFIRQRLGGAIGETLAKSTRILYGGSVKPDNIASLMAMPDVDGALVGGASLEADTFSRIVRF
jgi:triosephosphate isomerase